MKRLIAAAFAVALTTGATACSDKSPLAPDVTNPTFPPETTPVTPVPRGEIAFVGNGITLMNSDGSGAVQLGFGWSPHWSPDGSRIVFSNTECDTDWYSYYICIRGGLVIMNPETREVTIPSNGALGAEPAWSPGGDVIAFVRHDTGRLYLMRFDGPPAQELFLPNINDVFEPSWSPDGKRIAFGCLGFGVGVCVINNDGTGLVRLTSTDAYAVAPAWSPDGRTIAFQFWNLVRDMGEIALMKADGTGITHVTDGYSPVWSRDGTKLVFSGKAGGLFISNVDGSNVKRLTTVGHSPAWRP